jgi:hypothetical protein
LLVANLIATPRTVTINGPGTGHCTVNLDGWSVHFSDRYPAAETY